MKTKFRKLHIGAPNECWIEEIGDEIITYNKEQIDEMRRKPDVVAVALGLMILVGAVGYLIFAV
jgi:hypothetical protein